MQSTSQAAGARRWTRGFSLAVLAALAAPALAQPDAREHESHHPPGQTGAGPASQPQGGAGSAAMESMMERMGVPPARELYPEMMRLEDLTAERRQELVRRAQERRANGSERLARGLEAVDEAVQKADRAALSEALAEARAGIAELESGLATESALEAGEEPRQIALDWFREQMRIDGADRRATTGPFGLAWFHLFAMTLLALFAIVMIAMYFHKMRRATELLAQLAGGGSAPPPAAGVSETAAPASTPPPARTPDRSPAGPRDSAAIFDTLRKTGSCAGCKSPCATRVRVARVFNETPTVKTFRLVPLDGGPLPFEYLPGQYLNVIVSPNGAAGATTKRSYTIASSPTQAAFCEITVKREPEGIVSRFLHESLREGDELRIAAPYGRFTFTGDEAKSIVLIGGGVGITPLMSVVRYLTDRSWPGEITLLFCFRTPDDFIFRTELERLQQRHPNLRVVATASQAEGTGWTGRTGRLSADLVREVVPDIATRLVHLCGPRVMMDATRQLLLELGVARERIRFESFGPAAPFPTPVRFQEAAARAAATVAFVRSQKSAPLPPDLTILDVADAIGVEIEWSCRSGTCGSCKVKLLSGQVSMEVEDGLDDEDRADGLILACQARSTGDVAVEA